MPRTAWVVGVLERGGTLTRLGAAYTPFISDF